MEKFATVAGIRVRFRVFGDENSDRTILILHGWGGSSDSWIRFAELAAADGFRVVVPDLPGFGQTTEPSHPFAPKYFADFVAEFSREFCPKISVLVAHSNGARIATALLANEKIHPEKLILVGAAGIPHPLSTRQKIGATFAKFQKIVPLPLQNFARRILHRAIGVRDHADANSKTMRATLRLALDFDVRPLLPRVSVPTTVIWGDRDSYVPVSDADIFASEIPDAKKIILAGERHGIHLDSPEKLWAAISGK